MTTFQIIASVITWIAAVASMIGAAVSFRARLQARDSLLAIRAERRTFSIPGGGEFTVTAPMSDADYEAFRARWLAAYRSDGEACADYLPPASSADAGLCARCGMFDYKHPGAPRA